MAASIEEASSPEQDLGRRCRLDIRHRAHALRLARKIQRRRGLRRRIGGDEPETERLSHRPIVRNPTRPQLLILATGGKAFTPCASNGSQRRGDRRGCALPRGPSCQARFPADIIEPLMCCPRSVAFFMLLRMRNEGDVPRGAFEIEAALPRRKASFLPPAIDFLITEGNRHPPSALHTIHDIGPFSAVAGPHAGIGDDFDLSKFARGSHVIE